MKTDLAALGGEWRMTTNDFRGIATTYVYT